MDKLNLSHSSFAFAGRSAVPMGPNAPSEQVAAASTPLATEQYDQAKDPSAETSAFRGVSVRSGTGIPASRSSRAWMAVVPVLAVTALLLVFVLQNLRSAKVSFFTASGSLPLGLALLAAAALGGLVVFSLGSMRIVQLRKALRRPHRPRDHSQSASPSRAASSVKPTQTVSLHK
jgi:putative membrane protein